MTTLFVNYSERHLGGGEKSDPDEEGPYCSHEDTFQEFSVDSITLKNVTPYHEAIEYALPEPKPIGLFVVVVHYYDGGTFGRTCGYGSIEGVFGTHSEALERANELEHRNGKSIHGYNRWEGYFAGLERVEVALVPVL